MLSHRYRGLTRFLDNNLRDDGSASDNELLRRFVQTRDEAAFGALVKRHGGIVQQVCRQMNLDAHLADDVFQSTFLVLAKKAEGLCIEKSLGSLLHKTAYRIALDLLRLDRHRRKHEQAAAEFRQEKEEADVAKGASIRETGSIIHGELAALADTYRVPLVLHYLEGKSHEETARQLGLARRTVGWRIERGLAILRKRLTKHGCEFPAILVALALGKAEAAVPAGLAAATAKSAALFVQGDAQATSASLLASSALSGLAKLEGAARFAATIKLWLGKSALMLLAGTAVAVGTVGYLQTHDTAAPFRSMLPVAEAPSLPEVADDAPIELRGQVLDEAGRPVPHASVVLLADGAERGQHGRHDEVLRNGKADAEGRFVLQAPAGLASRRQAKLLAFGPGHAPGTAGVALLPGSNAVEVRLAQPTTVRGQVLGGDDRPVANAGVHLVRLGHVGREDVQGLPALQATQLAGWPPAVTTDSQGRFEFAGLSPRQVLEFEVRDRRHARHRIVLDPSRPASPQGTAASTAAVPLNELVVRLAPAQWLEGRVLAADTGKPLPYARLNMAPCRRGPRHAMLPVRSVDGRADAEGRFRLHPLPGEEFELFACAAENAPYVAMGQRITWPAGTVRQELTISLARGIPVRGRVVEADSGLPVAGAMVAYNALTGPQRRSSEAPWLVAEMTAWTGPDGQFFVPAPPGRGRLQVRPLGNKYLLRLPANPADSGATAATATVRLDLASNCIGEDVSIVVYRAGRLQGKVVEAARQPVPTGTLLFAGPLSDNDSRIARRVAFRAGEFRVANADRDCTYSVVLIDTAGEHACQAALTGKAESSAPEIALAPCGSARGRLLDENGRALTYTELRLAAILTFTITGSAAQEVETNWYRALGRDDPAATDLAGRFTLPALAPGMRYRLYAMADGDRRLAHEFTVTAGEALALPDATVRNE